MARVQLQESGDVAGGGFGLGEAAGLMRSFGLGSMTKGGIVMDDEISLLTSNVLLKKVALDLGVNVEYTKPYSFHRLYENNPFILTTDSLTNERLDEEIAFFVRPQDGKINIKTKSEKYGKNTFSFSSLPATLSLPNGDFTLDYANGQERNPVEKVDILFCPAGWVAEEMSKNFLIEELSKSSNIIELSCYDHEKNRGADMLNRLITFYNDETSAYKSAEARKTLAYINMRIDSLTYSLQQTENEIAGYKNINELTDIEHDVTLYVDQMRDIQTKLIELGSQSHLIQMMDEFVRDPANKYNLVPLLLSSDGERGSSLMEYNAVLMERSRVIQNSNIDNPIVGNLTEQANQLRESVYRAISNAQKATQQSMIELKNKEKSLYKVMRSFPDKERDFIELKRQQEIYQGVYIILLQKREETALTNDLDKERAKIIDAAFVKKKPVAPRKLFAALGMLLFTLVIPVVYLFVKEQLSALLKEYRRVKTPS
jgi:hypothetical protein